MLRILLCMLALMIGQANAAAPQTVLDKALEQAAQRRVAVLVDFRAPWCYSCYFMARHVQVGPEWDELQRRVLVLELDADSPEGAAQMQAWGIKALPAFVVLDARGHELGRLLGERQSQAFYPAIDRLLGPKGGLDDLRRAALGGGNKGVLAAQAALAAFYERRDPAAGIDWYYDLPGRVRSAYEADSNVQLAIGRLRLMQAADAGDTAACTAAAAAVLSADLGCERPYELQRYAACLGAAAPDELMQAQREPMEQLVSQRVLNDAPACADERSAVLGLADLHASLGDGAARSALLRRAIDQLHRRLAADLGNDRSAADNLRVYIEQLQDWAAYDALMPRMIATWPDDYVYPYRYGRSLMDRNQPSKALPYLERAAKNAYGQNRLKVAEQRVKALKRLGRTDDARRVAAEALKANGPWFPEEAAALKAQL